MRPFTRLAALKAQRPEYAIFRRWQALRALRLIQLSAEIAHLSDSLGIALDYDADHEDPEKSSVPSSPTDWYSQSQFSPQNNEQGVLWVGLDTKLGQHAKVLLDYQRMSRLCPADAHHFECLKEWLLADDGGQSFLSGTEATMYDRAMLSDMTSLCLPDESEDLITKFINTTLLKWYHCLIGHKSKKKCELQDPFSNKKEPTPVYYYSDRAVLAAVNTLGTLLAALVPALTSLGLFFIKSQLSRMGAIIGFTFLFATVLMLITSVKRAECFAITAAFSAVLVVFVGNNNGVGCSC